MQNPVDLLCFSSRKKLPMVLQTEIAECGLACLAMVASYHGHQVDLNTLRRHYPISLRGTTLHTLIQTADKMHFACRPLRLELEEMDQLRTPTILHWDMNHFVVLKKVTQRYVIIHDPAQGVRKLTMDEVSNHFTGVALELTPTPQFKPKNEIKKVPFSIFWERMVGLKRAMLQVFILSIALQLFSLVTPQYMQLVVDEVLRSYDVHFLTVLALGFLLLMVIEVCTTALRSVLVMSFSSMLNIQMATNLFRHLIRLPLPYFEKRHIGDVVSRFGSLSQIEKLLTTGIVQAIVDGFMAIATLSMLFLYAPLLACIVLIALVVYVLVRLLWYRPFRMITEETIVTSAKESTNFMETIRATQSIKIFGKEMQRQILWQNRYAEKMNTGIRLGKMKIAFSALNSFLFGVENIVVVYIAAKLVLAMSMTVGMLFAFMSYKTQFTGKAVALIENLIELKMLGLHLERLGDIVLEKEEVHEGQLLQSPVLKGGVRLDNIQFRYDENEAAVLHHIHLTIQPGESIAIVGPSGCGKTTLMKVMMGLFIPQEGTVYIDEIPLAKLGQQNFRDQFAAVMQNDQLLSGSISENISFFDPQPDQTLVEQCALFAMIGQDIAAMPMGYNTLIGDMGMALSGGQKQRVLLARALYKQPKILFLDEATSHLDVALEQAVNQAIKHLKITRIIIAHRPETIRSADRIFVFTKTGLVEQVGGFESLRNPSSESKAEPVTEA